MKTVYIPKGKTVHYESLSTEHLVVMGCLNVDYGIKAKTISGSGVIYAGTVGADTIRIDDVEAASVVCKRLIAKRAQAPELFASESAAVSCFLSAAHGQRGDRNHFEQNDLQCPDAQRLQVIDLGGEPHEETTCPF